MLSFMKRRKTKMQLAEVITTERPNGTRRVQIKIPKESPVEQHHAKRQNINTIMARYRKTGLLPNRVTHPTYGDFSGIPDFQEAQQRIAKAEQDFLDLPAEIRSRFRNDVGELLDFINRPENEQEAVRMGLIPKRTTESSEPEIAQLRGSSEPEPANKEASQEEIATGS